MSKRVYTLTAADLGEALSPWLLEKFPELNEVDHEADMIFKIKRRTGEIVVEIEA